MRLGLLLRLVGSVAAQQSLDEQALRAFFDATGGTAAWRRSSGWATDVTSPCSWYGVSCVDNAVDEVDVSGNDLDGTLPALFFAQPPPNLKRLDLAGNSIAGTIPTEWGPNELQDVRLSSTTLSGTLPAAAFGADRLVKLDIGRTSISGTIMVRAGGRVTLKHVSSWSANNFAL